MATYREYIDNESIHTKVKSLIYRTDKYKLLKRLCFFLCLLVLDLLKFQLEEKGWHTTTGERKENNISEKKLRKRFCVKRE